MVRYLAATLLALSATLGWAAGSAVLEAEEGGRMQLEYDGDRVRMSADGMEDGYLIIREGRMYTVSGDTVIDASSMFGMFSDSLQTPAGDVTQVHELKATGRRETVAGIAGEVHLLDYTDEEGKRQQQEVVLSNDRRAVELQQAWMTMAEAVASAMGEEDVDASLNKALGQRGILRIGNDMRVHSLSDRRPAAARFELPSEPQDMGGLGKAISEAFGGRTERQKDRVERRTDSEVDRASDRAVDKALDKAFGRIFGR